MWPVTETVKERQRVCNMLAFQGVCNGGSGAQNPEPDNTGFRQTHVELRIDHFPIRCPKLGIVRIQLFRTRWGNGSGDMQPELVLLVMP